MRFYIIVTAPTFKELVRPEEVAIVVFILLGWIAIIFLFIHKWGKIRGLEPYTPSYERTSITVSSAALSHKSSMRRSSSSIRDLHNHHNHSNNIRRKSQISSSNSTGATDGETAGTADAFLLSPDPLDPHHQNLLVVDPHLNNPLLTSETNYAEDDEPVGISRSTASYDDIDVSADNFDGKNFLNRPKADEDISDQKSLRNNHEFRSLCRSSSSTPKKTTKSSPYNRFNSLPGGGGVETGLCLMQSKRYYLKN